MQGNHHTEVLPRRRLPNALHRDPSCVYAWLGDHISPNGVRQTALDSSPRQNDGGINGAEIARRGGDNVLDFSGSSHVDIIETAKAIQGVSYMMVDVVFLPDALPFSGNQGLISFGDGTPAQLHLYGVDTTNTIRAEVIDSTGTDIVSVDSEPIDQSWHQATVVWDEDAFILYVDGVPDSSTQTGQTYLPSESPGVGLIGSLSGGSGWIGSVQRVIVFTDPEEIFKDVLESDTVLRAADGTELQAADGEALTI